MHILANIEDDDMYTDMYTKLTDFNIIRYFLSLTPEVRYKSTCTQTRERRTHKY